ncbi:MAG: VWA domain-containing protein [Lachnoclostridium sp.]|nr:VWA domain-containing protein [Lachnoclostridium sp.]
MFSFAYPHLLYLLLLLPVMAGLFIWARMARRKKLARYGNPAVLEALMPDASKYMPWVKMVLGLVVMAILIVMIARPRATTGIGDEAETETVKARGIEVMVCIDVSNSMMASATDSENGISRLQRAKQILEKLIAKMNDDKVGLIVFAGDAYTQLPITSDYISAKLFLNNISTDMVPTQGTAIGAAIDMAMNSFTPDDHFQKAIIIITDGENFEDDAIKSARRAGENGIQVDVIGMGSGKSVRIPLGNGQYMVNPANGETVFTKLDEATARQIAEAGDGIYVNGASSSAVNEIDEKLDTLSKTEYERKSFSPQSEQFPVLAWIALILMTLYCVTVTRKISWLKKFTFFSK